MDSVIVSAGDWMSIVRLAKRAESTALAIAVKNTEFYASDVDFKDVEAKNVAWVARDRAGDLYCRYLAAISGECFEDDPKTPMEWAAKALGEIDRRAKDEDMHLKSKEELLTKLSRLCDEPRPE